MSISALIAVSLVTFSLIEITFELFSVGRPFCPPHIHLLNKLRFVGSGIYREDTQPRKANMQKTEQRFSLRVMSSTCHVQSRWESRSQ